MVADIAAEVSSYKMQSDLTLFTIRLRFSQMLNPCFCSAEGLARRERLSLTVEVQGRAAGTAADSNKVSSRRPRPHQVAAR